MIEGSIGFCFGDPGMWQDFVQRYDVHARVVQAHGATVAWEDFSSKLTVVLVQDAPIGIGGAFVVRSGSSDVLVVDGFVYFIGLARRLFKFVLLPYIHREVVGEKSLLTFSQSWYLSLNRT